MTDFCVIVNIILVLVNFVIIFKLFVYGCVQEGN